MGKRESVCLIALTRPDPTPQNFSVVFRGTKFPTLIVC